MTAKRIRYEVLPTKRADRKADATLLRWSVTRDSQRTHTFRLKTDAVASARMQARLEHDLGALTQLLVKGKEGLIQEERTYGADPRASKG